MHVMHGMVMLVHRGVATSCRGRMVPMAARHAYQTCAKVS